MSPVAGAQYLQRIRLPRGLRPWLHDFAPKGLFFDCGLCGRSNESFNLLLTPTAEIPAMLATVVQDAINDQINYELFSSYQYLSMAAWCEHEQFVGCASWLRIQSKEEYAHAMRLYDFLLARNCPIKLKAIAAPEQKFASVASVF